MRRIVYAVALTALVPAGAAAADAGVACVKAGEKRTIEVIAPGTVGAACDVRYSRSDSAQPSVPYHANNSLAFCDAKAAELAQVLTNAGYACAPMLKQAEAAPAPVAPEPPQTTVAEPVAPAPVETAANQTPPAKIVQPDAPTAPQTDDSAVIGDAPQAETTFAPAPVLGPVPAPVPAEEDLEEKMEAILTEPAAPAPEAVAVRGPAQLTSGAEQTPVGASVPAVGRLLGAAPDEPPAPRPAIPVTPTATTVAAAPAPQNQTPPAIEPARSPAPAAVVEETPPPQQPAVETAPPASGSVEPVPGRRPENVIRATLAAQAAAWNEGNLDAFMATYWKSDDLKFVSGIDVTKGWAATMKRYRERYADDSGLGWLGFDRVEVTMTTDDVAVVTGRFTHSKGEQATSGVFSMVMRRLNGVWRIVHDHTSAEPKSKP